MPSKRSYSKIKTYSKRRTYKKKAPSNKALNKKIKHIENNLIELKFVDETYAAAEITQTGNIFNTFCIPDQGTGSSERVGNMVMPTSLIMKLNFVTNAAQLAPIQLRVLVFWDRQCNGLDPVITGDSNANSLLDTEIITVAVHANRNYNTIDRYTILMDKLYTINPDTFASTTLVGAVNTITTMMPIEMQVNKRFKLSRKIKYDGILGTIADITTNSFNVVVIADKPTNRASVKADFRMYYKDA